MTVSTLAFERLSIDLTNPGQFFAACGLLELGDRLWGGAEGWFERNAFCLTPLEPLAAPTGTIAGLMQAACAASLVALDPDDETASPLQLGPPFGLRLDWWKDSRSGGDRLKTWAGRMSVSRIGSGMRAAAGRSPDPNRLFEHGQVVFEGSDEAKKVEPFYFDARRASNARPIDVGFAPDALGMTNVAYPAVEFLALIGLQRVRPAPTRERRVFEYSVWSAPLSPSVASCIAAEADGSEHPSRFRFEVGFRTDQRKHKAFMPATAIERNR